MHFESGERVHFIDQKINLLVSYDKPPLPGLVVIGRNVESGIIIDETEWDDFVKLIAVANKYIEANRRDDAALQD